MSDARPTVAHVLHRLYLAGAEVLAADLSRRLGDRYRFVFLCLDEVGPLGEQLRREGLEVRCMHRRPGVDLSVARRIAGATRELRIDLLHAHQYTPFFYSAASRGLAGSLTGRPSILFTEHGRHYPDHRSGKRVLFNRLLLRPGDRVTAVGEFVKRALVNNEGLAERRVEVVHNGIDPAAFSLDAAGQRSAVRKELGIADTQPVLIQVARFHPVKDHATAVRAFTQAVRTLGDTVRPVLLLVGDGEKRGDIEQLVGELGVREGVRFLGVRSDVARLIAAADVFVLSSLSEGISVTLLEAMGCGLPIVATDVGGNGEVVEHGRTGLLSPRGDHESLARHMTELVRDPARAQEMGCLGRERLLERFTQQRMHERYATLYAQMLGR